MAYLNQKRAEMAAMSEMAVVAEQQIALANNVASRMQQIESLLEERPDEEAKPGGTLAPAGEGDAEVEYWKQKIAELSGPATSSSSESQARPALAPRELRVDENKADRSNYLQASSRGKPHASPSSSYASAPPYAEAKDSRSSYSSGSGSGRGGGGGSGGGTSTSRSREVYRESSAMAAPAAKHSAGDSSSERMAPSAKFEEPLDGDAEVEYWKRKIAELSQPVGGTGHNSTVTYSTNSSPIGLGGGIGIGGGLAVRRRGPQEDLASQKLSWEGSQSYADENPDAKVASVREGDDESDEGKQAK